MIQIELLERTYASDHRTGPSSAAQTHKLSEPCQNLIHET